VYELDRGIMTICPDFCLFQEIQCLANGRYMS